MVSSVHESAASPYSMMPSYNYPQQSYYGMPAYGIPPVQGFDQMSAHAGGQGGGGSWVETPKKGGMMRGLLKMVTRPKAWLGLARGAVLGTIDGIVKTFFPPSMKTVMALGMIAAGVFIPALLPFLIAGGVLISAYGLGKNTMQAAALYGSGQDELGDKAMEGVGTSAMGLGLAVFGARAAVRSGAISGGTIANPAEAGALRSTVQVFKESGSTLKGATSLRGATAADTMANVKTAATDAWSTGKANAKSIYNNTIKSDTESLVKLDNKGNPIPDNNGGFERIKVDFRRASDDELITRYAHETPENQAKIVEELTSFKRGYTHDPNNNSFTHKGFDAAINDAHNKNLAAQNAAKGGADAGDLQQISTELRYESASRAGAVERQAQLLSHQDDLLNPTATVDVDAIKANLKTASDQAKSDLEAARKLKGPAREQAIDIAKSKQQAVRIAERKMKAYEAHLEALNKVTPPNAAPTLKLPSAFDKGSRFYKQNGIVYRTYNVLDTAAPGLIPAQVGSTIANNNPFANINPFTMVEAPQPQYPQYPQSAYTLAA